MPLIARRDQLASAGACLTCSDAVPTVILLHIYSLRDLLRQSTKVEVVENRRATIVIAG